MAFVANVVFWRGVDFVDMTLINYLAAAARAAVAAYLEPRRRGTVLPAVSHHAVDGVAWRRTLVLPLLVAGTAVSFALSAWLTQASPGVAFYLLPARGWELLAGGLVAWYGAAAPPLRGPTGEAAAAAGLALVLVPAFLYDSGTPFPGIYAVAPVLGTVLLLRYAPGSITGARLSWPPLVFVGLISYSAYLWHQPLFALTRYVSLSGQLGMAITVALFAATLVLAASTWRWVETPFRDRRTVATRTLIWSCTLATIASSFPRRCWRSAGMPARLADRLQHRQPIDAVIVHRLQHHAATDAASRPRLPARSVVGGAAVVPGRGRQPFRRPVPGIRENQPRDRQARPAAPAFFMFAATGNQRSPDRHTGLHPHARAGARRGDGTPHRQACFSYRVLPVTCHTTPWPPSGKEPSRTMPSAAPSSTS